MYIYVYTKYMILCSSIQNMFPKPRSRSLSVRPSPVASSSACKRFPKWRKTISGQFYEFDVGFRPIYVCYIL